MFFLGWNYLLALPTGIALAAFFVLLLPRLSRPNASLYAAQVGILLWLLACLTTLVASHLTSPTHVATSLHNQVGYALGTVGALSLPFIATITVLLLGRSTVPAPMIRLSISLFVGVGYVAVLPPLLFGGAIFGCALVFAPSCL